MSSLRPRRSALYMPAANERALEKAKGISTDAIIFDLEDAVSPDSKDIARALGKDATFHVYPGTHHAFFNDTREEVYDAAVSKTAWERTLALFRDQL